MEFEGCLTCVVQHKFHTSHTQNIGNFVGIRNGGNCSMNNGSTGKLSWNQHGTFNMNVGINEPWQDMMGFDNGFFNYRLNSAVFNMDSTGKNALI